MDVYLGLREVKKGDGMPVVTYEGVEAMSQSEVIKKRLCRLHYTIVTSFSYLFLSPLVVYLQTCSSPNSDLGTCG